MIPTGSRIRTAVVALIGACGVVCASAGAAACDAQAVTASITVIVRDSLSSLALHDVTVTLLDSAGIARRTKTDHKGQVQFDSLPPTKYKLVADARMFDSTSATFAAKPGERASRSLLMRGRVRQPEFGAKRQAQMDSLNAAKARWRTASLKGYRVTAKLSCFCMSMGTGDDVTADQLFDRIERTLRDPFWEIRSAVYDRVNGLPKSFYIDTTSGTTDMWTSWTVSLIQVPASKP